MSGVGFVWSSSLYLCTRNKWNHTSAVHSLQRTWYTFPCKRSLLIQSCVSDGTLPSSSDSPKVTEDDQKANAPKQLYRPIDYPLHTEAYLSSEPIREALWKHTYERTQREEEADRNLQLLAEQVTLWRKQVEDALREQGVDPEKVFQEADAIFTPLEEAKKDAIQASIERGCPPDDIDLGDYPYIDVPDIPENLELENLGWVGLKDLGASPLPEMIEEMKSRRRGVVAKNSFRETASEEEDETDFSSTLSVPDFVQENKVYVKEGLGWRIGYEPFSTGEQCATVGSKDYLIAMNKEEFFHFRRLLMSLDHKLTDMTYHSSSSEQQEEVSSFRMMETTTTYPQNSNNGMEDHSPFMQPTPLMDLESDILRIQAFGRPNWFSLHVFLKRKRPVEW